MVGMPDIYCYTLVKKEKAWRTKTMMDYEGLDPDFKNDVDHISGNWQLYEMEDGRTLARFETRVRVGGALPGWLQDTVSRKKIPQTLKRCRVWANNEG